MRKSKKRQVFLILLLTLAVQLTAFGLLNRQAGRWLNPYFRPNHAYRVGLTVAAAHSFHLSYNNKYLSFIRQQQLVIVDLLRNEKVDFTESPTIPAGTILAVKWLPDRNSLVYIEKNGLNGNCSLFSLDLAETASETENIPAAKIVKSIGTPVEQVIDLQISTYTGNLYLFFQDNEKKHQLLQIDLMQNINRVDQPDEAVAAVAVANKYGTLYLETGQGASRAIVAELNGKRTVLARGEQNILLGCSDEQVFIGKVQGGRLKSILALKTATGGQGINLWQGDLPYDPVQVQISADEKVLLQGEKELAIFQTGAAPVRLALPENTVVLSPDGKMYLEIIAEPSGFRYYWRTL